MNAVGNYVLPALIFPQCQMKAELQDGAPPRSMFLCQVSNDFLFAVLIYLLILHTKSLFLLLIRKKDGSTAKLFVSGLNIFIKYAKPSKENKFVNILHRYKSHNHNILALQRASESGIIMLSLSPHTSHKMQPLYLTFLKPFKTYYYYYQYYCFLVLHVGKLLLLA